MAKDFLLEIGTEEIPTGYISEALPQMEKDFRSFLATSKIDFKDLKVWGTPRRLVIIARGIAEKQQDQRTEITGPPKQVAYDANGNLTPAGIGFAKKQNIKPQSLTIKKTEKGEYLCAVLSQKGQHTDKIMAAFLPQFITSIYFPKTMRWETRQLRFARPVRWLLCLWGKQVLKFKLGELSTGNKTKGHLILTGNKEIAIKNIALYEKSLNQINVIADPEKRKARIKAELIRVTKGKGRLHEDDTLLSVVTNLTEYPTAILGKFDRRYLNLPAEVLITCLRHHQKYFTLVDSQDRLLPYFVGISNGDPKAASGIREGYERVLSARLEDAAFFYKIDTETHLEEKVEKLRGVVFQEKLGSLYGKIERVIKLSESIASQIPFTTYNLADVRRTALLCKADLVTEMVKEFPELQGIIGKEYALKYNEKEEVSQGLYEHYLPLSMTGQLPRTANGAIVSIADKMDTIVSDFAIGLIPDSSGDPYGLRRQAQGIVRILIANQWNFSLFELIEKAIRILKESGIEVVNTGELLNKVWKFFRERIEYIFGYEPYKLAYDEIAAALDVGYSEVHNTLKRAQALQELRPLPDFEPIAAGFKRANNILKQARDKNLVDEVLDEGEKLDEGRLAEEAEKQLYRKFIEIKAEAEQYLGKGDYTEALRRLVSLRPDIDTFFNKVMVMVEDRQLMTNRLMLLKEIAGLFLRMGMPG
ncbi:MAG: glycine--tRNA ligase subunit beta [Elusimicrobia bacterium]|nr:glycine--tRNA ligase subunit beta [Elusimicrobiota bacterium]